MIPGFFCVETESGAVLSSIQPSSVRHGARRAPRRCRYRLTDSRLHKKHASKSAVVKVCRIILTLVCGL
ncbi:hypothetical protein F2P81_008972 [Scophthalmus maximus]|uniref:Uncharacterized protein n=1 Tax=Scophthalmus maximus TaxID=52904 RepID=A0A6A4T2C6_SCOMX|nr:hypothetical protein F2P81_008972 [Scophthalmus maximus]